MIIKLMAGMTVLLMALTGCTPSMFLSEGDFFHLEHDGATMPVWVKGNFDSDVILIAVLGLQFRLRRKVNGRIETHWIVEKDIHILERAFVGKFKASLRYFKFLTHIEDAALVGMQAAAYGRLSCCATYQ